MGSLNKIYNLLLVIDYKVIKKMKNRENVNPYANYPIIFQVCLFLAGVIILIVAVFKT